MTTLYTLAIITALLIVGAFCVSFKWGICVLAFIVSAVLAILAIQFYAGRWL